MNRVGALIALILVALSVGPASWSCSRGGFSGEVQSLAVAWSPFDTSTLLWVAQDRGLFSRNGLDVTLVKYDTGAAALGGTLEGEADIGFGITEFPVVGSALNGTEVRIIGTAARIEQQYLVGRRDRGIERVSDLQGKRVGTTFGTIAQFYLGRFLELNGLGMDDVTAVDLKTPAEWENAVSEGIVDAIVTAQPYADLASQHLGDNAIVWPVQGGQRIFGLIVASEAWITGHPEPVGRFLMSMADAEDYATSHPSEAKVIMKEWLGMDDAFAEATWLRGQFLLSLGQSLVLAMEDQARWMIKNGLTTRTEVPDFNDYIREGPLRGVKPEAVNIIR